MVRAVYEKNPLPQAGFKERKKGAHKDMSAPVYGFRQANMRSWLPPQTQSRGKEKTRIFLQHHFTIKRLLTRA